MWCIQDTAKKEKETDKKRREEEDCSWRKNTTMIVPMFAIAEELIIQGLYRKTL